MEQVLGSLVPLGTPVFVYGLPRFLSKAFSLGCSDFLREPFDYSELKARALKRVPPPVILLRGRLYLLSNSGLEPYYPENTPPPDRTRENCRLTYHEVTILRMLISNRANPVYREALQYALWGERRDSSRAVDMHVASLRKKLIRLKKAQPARGTEGEAEDGIESGGEKGPRNIEEGIILTVRSVGYRLSTECCSESCG
ncbi:MAG: winged helix-turn-helix domain-containing protein [Spirochaetia bacterium]